MNLRKAERKQARIKMGLMGPSGSGKTYGALQIAYGLTGDYSKIVVIDTENHSADLYSHLGDYQVIGLGAPFTPERYIEALTLCEESGMEVIIIDSISHEWSEEGGILDTHSSMAGNSFTNWNKITPRHNAFVQSILQSSCHVIATIRSKQDYVISEKNGKMVPEKVGLKGVTRDNMDYEFTLVLNIDIQHNAKASKDRTGLFMDKPEFIITPETGKTISKWCHFDDNTEGIFNQIEGATTVEELKRIMNENKHLLPLIEDAIYEKNKHLQPMTHVN
ncbi:AAA family ATPase [Bacteroidota bacterium]